MLRQVFPGSSCAGKACSSGLPAARSGRSRKSFKTWDSKASLLNSSLRSTNQHAALKWGNDVHSPQAPSVFLKAPWIAQALNRPTWGGSYSSGESGSDDDSDFYQELSEDGFDEFARSPPPSGPRLTPKQRAELQAAVAATSGLGAVTLFDDLRAEQQEATRRELEQLQREGGDLDSLAAQVAADGYDLHADWSEHDRASSTTGRGKVAGSKGGPARSGPTPADVLYAPPSNPRLEAGRREARQEVTRKRRRLFDTPTENAGIIGGYVTEISPSSEASQEALLRQSELRGQKLRNLPRKWATDEPPEAPSPSGRKRASIDDALTDYFLQNLKKGYNAYQDKASGKFGLQRPKPPRAAEAAQQQQDKAVQLRRQQREQQARQQAQEQQALDDTAREVRDRRRQEQQAAEAEMDELEMLLAEQLGVATSSSGQKQGGLAQPSRPEDPALSSSTSSSSNSSSTNIQKRPALADPVMPQAAETDTLEVLESGGNLARNVDEEDMDDFEAAYAAVLAAQANSKNAGGSGGSRGGVASSSSSSSGSSSKASVGGGVARPAKPVRPSAVPSEAVSATVGGPQVSQQQGRHSGDGSISELKKGGSSSGSSSSSGSGSGMAKESILPSVGSDDDGAEDTLDLMDLLSLKAQQSSTSKPRRPAAPRTPPKAKTSRPLASPTRNGNSVEGNSTKQNGGSKAAHMRSRNGSSSSSSSSSGSTGSAGSRIYSDPATEGGASKMGDVPVTGVDIVQQLLMQQGRPALAPKPQPRQQQQQQQQGAKNSGASTSSTSAASTAGAQRGGAAGLEDDFEVLFEQELQRQRRQQQQQRGVGAEVGTNPGTGQAVKPATSPSSSSSSSTSLARPARSSTGEVSGGSDSGSKGPVGRTIPPLGRRPPQIMAMSVQETVSQAGNEESKGGVGLAPRPKQPQHDKGSPVWRGRTDRHDHSNGSSSSSSSTPAESSSNAMRGRGGERRASSYSPGRAQKHRHKRFGGSRGSSRVHSKYGSRGGSPESFNRSKHNNSSSSSSSSSSSKDDTGPGSDQSTDPSLSTYASRRRGPSRAGRFLRRQQEREQRQARSTSSSQGDGERTEQEQEREQEQEQSRNRDDAGSGTGTGARSQNLSQENGEPDSAGAAIKSRSTFQKPGSTSVSVTSSSGKSPPSPPPVQDLRFISRDSGAARQPLFPPSALRIPPHSQHQADHPAEKEDGRLAQLSSPSPPPQADSEGWAGRGRSPLTKDSTSLRERNCEIINISDVIIPSPPPPPPPLPHGGVRNPKARTPHWQEQRQQQQEGEQQQQQQQGRQWLRGTWYSSNQDHSSSSYSSSSSSSSRSSLREFVPIGRRPRSQDFPEKLADDSRQFWISPNSYNLRSTTPRWRSLLESMGVDVARSSAEGDALSAAPPKAENSEAGMAAAAAGAAADGEERKVAAFAPLENPDYWLNLLKERGLLMEGYVIGRRVEALDLVQLPLEKQNAAPHDSQLMLEEKVEVLSSQEAQHRPEDPMAKGPEDFDGSRKTLDVPRWKTFVVPRWSYRVSIPTLHRLGKRWGASIWVPDTVLTPETRRVANANIEQPFTDHSPVFIAEGQSSPIGRGFSMLQTACDSWTFVTDMESQQELHLVKKDREEDDDPSLPDGAEKPFTWKLVLAPESKRAEESGAEDPGAGHQHQQQQQQQQPQEQEQQQEQEQPQEQQAHDHSSSEPKFDDRRLKTVFTIVQVYQNSRQPVCLAEVPAGRAPLAQTVLMPPAATENLIFTDFRVPLEQQTPSESAAGTAAADGQCAQGIDATHPGSYTVDAAAAAAGQCAQGSLATQPDSSAVEEAAAASTGEEAARPSSKAAGYEQGEAAVQGSMLTEDVDEREQEHRSLAVDNSSSSSSSSNSVGASKSGSPGEAAAASAAPGAAGPQHVLSADRPAYWDVQQGAPNRSSSSSSSSSSSTPPSPAVAVEPAEQPAAESPAVAAIRAAVAQARGLPVTCEVVHVEGGGLWLLLDVEMGEEMQQRQPLQQQEQQQEQQHQEASAVCASTSSSGSSNSNSGSTVMGQESPLSADSAHEESTGRNGRASSTNNSEIDSSTSSRSKSRSRAQSILGYMDRRYLPPSLQLLSTRKIADAIKPGDLVEAKLQGTVFATNLWQRDVVVAQVRYEEDMP